MNRIVIVVNKTWEADAAFAAMFNNDFRKTLPGYDILYKDIKVQNLDYPWNEKYGATAPRVIYSRGNLQVEIWCLNTVMTENPDPNDPFYYSRAYQKAKDFPRILQYSADPIKLIAAYGTAGAPTEVTKNGGIVIGAGIFPYNANLVADDKKYNSDKFGTMVNSGISQDFFDKLNLGMSSINMKLYFETAALTPPNHPSNAFQFIADKNIIAVNDINVNSYDDFKSCDPAALAAFTDFKKKNQLKQTAYSIETTHGVIILESKCENFIFISAITDRAAYFGSEVTPKLHAQNFSAAFNGGVFFNWFIPFLFQYF